MPVQACGANPFASSTRGDGAEAPNVLLNAEAAWSRDHDPAAGIDLELLTIGAHAEKCEATFEATFERIGFSDPVGAHEVHVDLLSAAAEIGTNNPDGSAGFGIGASIELAGVEGTANLDGANSITFGVSAGAGLHLSVGLRDTDHDGKREVCARVFDVLTLGGCFELPF
jgi:hypothetical protein